MTFKEILAQVSDWLQQEQRLSYREVQRQFGLDDAYLEDLKVELIEVRQIARDEDGKMLVWRGTAVPAAAAVAPAAPPQTVPLTYTPPYLAEKILTSRSALEGERKQVTVLFADLKGSMELLADRDPEEARQLLDPVLERMMAAVHRYEGTVNQVLGDGIMALFGAPIAHEDHAVRACYAALAMQESVKGYAADVQRTYGVPLHMRVGLNAGEVVVRAIGNDLHMDYSAIGQTTHLAARMEQMAMPGSILMTQAVLNLAESYVQVTPLGAVPVKGLSAPVAVFELLRASAIQRRFQAAAVRGLTRFVGRDTEFAALVQALERAAAGHGQVAALVGEAGVGKSRLVYEFIHSHHVQGWRVLESASVSYGKATPYFPVIDLLKRYAQVEERDEARTVRAKVTGQVLTLDGTLQETIPALLSLLDTLPDDSPWLRLDPHLRRQCTLAALKRVLLRESQVQPLLLVFEDLHWIDAETQALLDGLVERLPTAQILLLVNYRTEYQHGWGGKPYYAQLHLAPLQPASAAEVLQALLGNHPSLTPLKQLLIERSDGNPFFLEESVRTLVETQVLAGVPGVYRLEQALPTIHVPATVQAVLAARLDRLPLEEKRLLQTAAVIGTEVPLPLLQAIAELPVDPLQRGLAHLQAAEFLYETRLFPEHAYTFKHALTHEVAYGSLLQERRRALHARIVEALEGLAGEGAPLNWRPSADAVSGQGLHPVPTQSRQRAAEQVERLAYHALRGEVWDKAVDYLRQALGRAMARSAHREAVTCTEQALMALNHLAESREKLAQAIDLRFALRHALWPFGAMERILDVLQQAETLAEALGDPRRLGLACAYLCTSFYGIAEHDQAVAAGERAVAHSTSTGALDLQAVATTNLGQAYVARTDWRRATDILEGSVALLPDDLAHERFGQGILPGVLCRVVLVRGLVELGRFPQALATGEEAVRIAEAVNHPASLLLGWWACGLPSLRRGDVGPAIVALERATRICHEVELPIFLHWVEPTLGAAYALAGRAGEALALLERRLEQDTAMHVLSQSTLTTIYLAEAHLRAGNVQEATDHATRALALSHQRHERGYAAWARRLIGDILSCRQAFDPGGAAVAYQEALSLAQALEMRPLVAHCHLGIGRLRQQADDHPTAADHLSRAATMYRDMEMRLWLDQATAALAQAM
jgi:class 3 adenylate cyclase/tetratricopeptide (TPR) repeat protein